MVEKNNIKTSCPICKEDKHLRIEKTVSSIYSIIPYSLASCENCGHLFTASTNKSELNKIYQTAYNYEAHLLIEKEKKWRLNKTFSIIRRSIPIHTTILDVGCMYGLQLEAFRDFGYKNILGIEIDSSAVEECKKKGFDVFEGTFSQWFDSRKLNKVQACIFLSHVIEHIQDINSFFDQANRILKSDSFLIIIAPNSKSLTSMLFEKYWGWWQVPVHFHHFSYDVILDLLLANGFTIETSFKRGGDSLFWLSTLASLLGIRSKSHNNSRMQRMIIRSCSSIFKYWYLIGNEELIVIARQGNA